MIDAITIFASIVLSGWVVAGVCAILVVVEWRRDGF